MFSYQKTNRYFAQITDGLEALGEEELLSLGAKETKAVYRGIYFTADPATLYRITYLSRLCSRVLAELIRFDCHSTKYLHQTAKKLDWPLLLSEKDSFAIKATVSHSKVKHSHYAALCLKDAIVDSFREKSGKRPRIEKINPDLFLNLHISNNKAVVSLDISGGALHRRGYRQQAVTAPMQETLAAAIIKLTGWDGQQSLYDPMCGSGTLLCEALCTYCRIPAGKLRKKFGFEVLPDFNRNSWLKVKEKADRNIRRLPPAILAGSDKSGQAVQSARENLAKLPDGKKIIVRKADYQSLKELKNRILVCNPPYGIRMNKENDMKDFMKAFGDFLKNRCKQSTAYLYLGDRQLIKSVGLKPTWKKALKSGGLEGILAKYELY